MLDFTFTDRLLLNTNGVEQHSRTSHYDFGVMFSARAGGRSTSFNFAGFAARDLDRPLWEHGRAEALLAEAAGQLDARPVPEKFVGEVVVTPESLEGILSFLVSSISDHPMDGYRVEDAAILDRGVLKTFLLSLYGSRKTGRPRGPSEGGCYVVEPGDTPYRELLRGVKQGILLGRFSGGRPPANGDFAGVARNSSYIRNGEIAFPLSETMISGNLQSLLGDVRRVSRERVDFGAPSCRG